MRSLSEVLGRTEGGLTTRQINELLAAARIADPTPPAPRGTYVAISKRDRLFNALAARQRGDGCGNAVLAFVTKALAPVRFHESPGAFEAGLTRSRIRRDSGTGAGATASATGHSPAGS